LHEIDSVLAMARWELVEKTEHVKTERNNARELVWPEPAAGLDR
jgi:hypothetical protein